MAGHMTDMFPLAGAVACGSRWLGAGPSLTPTMDAMCQHNFGGAHLNASAKRVWAYLVSVGFHELHRGLASLLPWPSPGMAAWPLASEWEASSTSHSQEDPGKRPKQTGGPDGNYGSFVYKHRQICLSHELKCFF